jgi:hypothetical protein
VADDVAELVAVVEPVELTVDVAEADNELVAEVEIDVVTLDVPLDVALDVAVLVAVLWVHSLKVPCR